MIDDQEQRGTDCSRCHRTLALAVFLPSGPSAPSFAGDTHTHTQELKHYYRAAEEGEEKVETKRAAVAEVS